MMRNSRKCLIFTHLKKIGHINCCASAKIPQWLSLGKALNNKKIDIQKIIKNEPFSTLSA